MYAWLWVVVGVFFFFQAEDGIRDLVRSRGLGDVYKRQVCACPVDDPSCHRSVLADLAHPGREPHSHPAALTCLLYTSDAADERSSVDLGGRRIIKKKTNV